MTKLDRILEKCSAILQNAEKAYDELFEHVARDAPKAADVEAAANAAVQYLKPKIGRFLQANYDSAGLRPVSLDNKRPHLGLREACGNPLVWCRVEGQNLILSYALPNNMKASPGDKSGHQYVDKDTDRPYRAASSLNFGAVHAPHKSMSTIDLSTAKITGFKTRSILGAKLKRSLKRHVLTQEALSPRVRRYLSKAENMAVTRPDRILKRSKGSVILPKENAWRHNKSSVTLGSSGITIMKPKVFWELDTEQVQEIKVDLFERMGLKPS